MGMYTEFHFNVELKRDTPEGVLTILRYMLDSYGEDGKRKPAPEPLPDHPLFTTARWGEMLLGDSYYFAADTHSTMRFDDISNANHLCIRCNLKNYDGEIEHFLDWIMPWVDAFEGDFLGFYRYEETEDPTLIRKEAGRVV